MKKFGCKRYSAEPGGLCSNNNSGNGGLPATSQADFSCRDMVPWDSRNAQGTLSRVIWTDNKGIHLKTPLVPGATWSSPHTAILPCGRLSSRPGQTRIGIPLQALSARLECFVRAPSLPLRELPQDAYPDFKYPQRQICVVRQKGGKGGRVGRRLPQVLRAAECGNREVVRLPLMKGGGGARGSIEVRDEVTQRTPLLGAARCGHAGVVELLARHGANVEAVDGEGCTLLVLAAMGEHGEVVRVLIEWGADLEARIGGGWTPLLWAAQEGWEGVVELLVEGGADVEAVDDGGGTPLLWAVARRYEATARALIKSAVNLEAADGGGCTALLCAAESGLTEIVRPLVEAGANLEAVDGNGNSALRLASKRGHKAVMKLLREAGNATVGVTGATP